MQLVNATKLTISEDIKAWSVGVGTGVASSPFLLVFGPAVGYYIGKAVHKKTVMEKIKRRLAEEGDLKEVLKRWNENFKERGVMVWLELPPGSGEVLVDLPPGTDPRDIEKAAKRQTRRFRIMVMPCGPGGPSMSTQQSSPVSPTDEGKGESSVFDALDQSQNEWEMQHDVATHGAAELPGQDW